LYQHLKNIICLACVLTPFHTALAETTEKSFDASNVYWSKLSYSTSVLLVFKLSADVMFKLVDSNEIETTLFASNRGKGLMPKDDKTVLLTMFSNNLGRKSQLSLWLDSDLRALQRTQLDTNRRHRQKIFRFLDNGVYSLEKKPKRKEKKLPIEKWSKKSENFYPTETDYGGQPLTDDVALFYAISASSLNNPGDEFKIYTFDKKENYVVTVTAIENADLDVDYVEEHHGNTRVVKGKTTTLKLQLTAKPYKNSSNVETKFLNLSKGIDIYLDKKTRAILQISAKLKYVGWVNITLDKIYLN